MKFGRNLSADLRWEGSYFLAELNRMRNEVLVGVTKDLGLEGRDEQYEGTTINITKTTKCCPASTILNCAQS
jgi:hypothetical protein